MIYNEEYKIKFYVDKKIILLHAFLKKTDKTPIREIEIAVNRYNNAINNPKIYED